MKPCLKFFDHRWQRRIWKELCPLIPANAEEDENGEVEIQAYSFTENEDGTEGDLQPIPEDSDAEWDMIEEVFNSFMEGVIQSGRLYQPNSEKLERAW